MSDIQTNRPDFVAYTVRAGVGDKRFWSRIGCAWSHEKDGLTVKLESLPLTGEIVLRAPKADNQEGGAQ